ncbi:cholinesterase-like [Amblyomma americanum]
MTCFLPEDSDVSHKRKTACPQPRLGNIGLGARWITDEDCLRLNIWVPMGCVPPGTPRCGNKTVLVFLTGGLFQQGDAGDASADGSLLASLGDVAVVTVTYRLGALGFLCASDERDAGNMGLYDQLEAMAWVRNYIAYFGGNESEIAVVGHGSGAVSLGYHMLNANSGWAHFINRFIVMSNSPYNRQIDSRAEATNKTASLSRELGCGDLTDDPTVALDCLRDVNVTALLGASSPMGDHSSSLFFPVHGSDLVPVRPSLLSHFVSVREKKVLIGYTASAGAYHAALLAYTQSGYVFEP